MSPRPKDSTREKTAEKKEKILESAMDTFAEKGFDGANMRQIASAAGVNKYMLYYHFEDKMTLFEQVLETVSRPVFSRLTAAIHDAANLEQAVSSYLRNINCHYAYQELRKIRSRLRSNMQIVQAESLAEGLMSYSERGQGYIDELLDMIRINRKYMSI